MQDWIQGCEHLVARDPRLGALIERYPDHRLSGSGDAFRTLANAIVGQQISIKAADAIFGRLQTLCQTIEPLRVASLSTEELRACGLSGRKVEYLQGLASAFIDKSIDPLTWEHKSDETILAELIALRGIGRWTAEMALIFLLKRPDILPLDDIALVRAAAAWYGWPNDKTAVVRLKEHAEQWRPYRTIAVWFLWRTQDETPIIY